MVPSNRIFHHKPSTLGYPHFRKPPFDSLLIIATDVGCPRRLSVSISLTAFCNSAWDKGKPSSAAAWRQFSENRMPLEPTGNREKLPHCKVYHGIPVQTHSYMI